MFLHEKKHRYLKNDSQFFDALKTKDHKVRGNFNSLTKVKFHELEWSSPLRHAYWIFLNYFFDHKYLQKKEKKESTTSTAAVDLQHLKLEVAD